jgi:hypothetical protein
MSDWGTIKCRMQRTPSSLRITVRVWIGADLKEYFPYFFIPVICCLVSRRPTSSIFRATLDPNSMRQHTIDFYPLFAASHNTVMPSSILSSKLAPCFMRSLTIAKFSLDASSSQCSGLMTFVLALWSKTSHVNVVGQDRITKWCS